MKGEKIYEKNKRFKRESIRRNVYVFKVWTIIRY